MFCGHGRDLQGNSAAGQLFALADGNGRRKRLERKGIGLGLGFQLSVTYMPSVTRPESVEEFHGPYGPYHVSELVLQKIWLEQAFDAARLRDEKGRRIEVVHPGMWNRLDGPDFRNAVLRFDGVEVRGDVEVHFSQADWRSHGHESDPAYDSVVLHVLYYDPGNEARGARTSEGRLLPRVALLPILWYSLEEYAGDDSLIASTGVDLRPEVESLLQSDLETRKVRLRELAQRRWLMKRHYAALRIERLGWEGACHQSALEVMGFARNRVPMLMVAERYALSEFAAGSLSPETLIAAAGERWRLSGCRPANQPVNRLRQYLAWARVVPDWPQRLARVGEGLAEAAQPMAAWDWGSAALRSDLGLQRLRKLILALVIGDQVSGTKLDTLVCDAFLPLVAAKLDTDCFAHWFHWKAGDKPDYCVEALRLLQVLEPRKVPLSNGWLQGALGAKSFTNIEERGQSGFQAHA